MEFQFTQLMFFILIFLDRFAKASAFDDLSDIPRTPQTPETNSIMEFIDRYRANLKNGAMNSAQK